MINDLARFLTRLIFPATCRCCSRELSAEEKYFCAACFGGATKISQPLCTYCGAPFPHGVGIDHPCMDCMRKKPPFDKARAAVLYEGVIRDAIRLYKYRPVRGLKKALGEFTSEAAVRWFPDATMVMPVPLHRRRLWKRGFNQSLFLAESAAEALGVKVSLHGLGRIRHTRPQVGLSPDEREKNINGAFKIAGDGDVKGGRVLLVDDVYTTGATARECAKMLRRAGAEKVYILTVAQAGADSDK